MPNKRLVLLSTLCTGMGLALIWAFVLIHIQGAVCFVESNPWTLWTETIGLGAIVVFGLYMFVTLSGNRRG